MRGGCLGIKTHDNVNLTVCHFDTILKPDPPYPVQRGDLLGLRDPSTPWIHLSLDARYASDGSRLPTPPPAYLSVAFIGAHTLEGHSFSTDEPTPVQHHQCQSIVSTNAISAGTDQPALLTSFTPIWSNPCTLTPSPVSAEPSVHPLVSLTNDFFSSATQILGLPFGLPFGLSLDNSGATREDGEPWCGPNTVWFRYAASANADLEASTEGSNFDTILGVLEGTDLTHLTPIACVDDQGSEAGERVAFQAQAGHTYYLQVSGARGATGNLAVAFRPAPSP